MKRTGGLTTNYFFTKVFLQVKADSLISKDEDRKRRALILWTLSGWERQKGASICRDLPVRSVDL